MSHTNIVYLNTTIIDELINTMVSNANTCYICQGKPESMSDVDNLLGSGGKTIGKADASIIGPNAGTHGRKFSIKQMVLSVLIGGVVDFIGMVGENTDISADELFFVAPMGYSAITAVDTDNDKVTIDKSALGTISSGQKVTIRAKTGDNGIYTVTSATVESGSVVLALDSSLSDSTADGYVIYQVADVSTDKNVRNDIVNFEIGSST